MLNPLSFRVPLFDPDKLLDRLAAARAGAVPPGRRWWRGRWWCCSGLLRGRPTGSDPLVRRGAHAHARAFCCCCGCAIRSIKALHELGHGLAVKAWGGEVREIGVSLLLLVPVPFVDASAASAFPEKHRRVLVGAAGIMVELFLAALALFVWLQRRGRHWCATSPSSSC